MPHKWTAETKGTVTIVRVDGLDCGESFWSLLRSDAHHDSPYCNRSLEKKHLDLALERNALIFDAGDTFDAMQGKFDPRRTMEDVREEDRKADYYDSIVKHAAEDYEPYAQNWVMFGKGNHETAVLDKANNDLISNLCFRMNSEYGSNILPGVYGGWVKFYFSINKTKRFSINVRYHHGSGTSAPVTRGVIQTNRQQVFLPDADVIWNGHNHQMYALPIKRERINTAGRVFYDHCWHVRTPGYKDEWSRGEGYAVEHNGGPTPLGCAWLEFIPERDGVRVKAHQDIE